MLNLVQLRRVMCPKNISTTGGFLASRIAGLSQVPLTHCEILLFYFRETPVNTDLLGRNPNELEKSSTSTKFHLNES